MEQPTAALPAGWAEYTDPTSGKAFYHNVVTNETTWARPTAPGDAVVGAAATVAAGQPGACAAATQTPGGAGADGAFPGRGDASATLMGATGMGLGAQLDGGAAVAAAAASADAAAMYAAAMGMAPAMTSYAAMAGAVALPEGTGWTAVGGPASVGQAQQGGALPGGLAMAGGAAAGGAVAAAQPGGSAKSGTVKLWNEEKGFGFISPGTGGDDIFVHRSTLEDGLSLAQGSTVRYEAQWNPQRNKFAVTRCTGAQAGKGGAAGGKGGVGFAGTGPSTVGSPSVVDGSMQQGTVKVWYDDKGFGFLIPDGGGEDVFVHRHALSDGQALVQGSQVTFRIAWNDQKGKYLATECSGAVGEASAKGGKGKAKGAGGYGKAGGPEVPGARPVPYGAGVAMTSPAPAGENNMQQAFPQQAVQNLHLGGYMGVTA